MIDHEDFIERLGDIQCLTQQPQTMKAKIGTYKKPRTSLPIGMRDVINLEMVLMRHVSREFKRRNLCPSWERGMQRLDIREALHALRAIKSTPLELTNVD